MSPPPKKVCTYCGCELAIGAIACFRCGRLLEGPSGPVGDSGSDRGFAPTHLRTGVREALLEGRWLLKDPVGMAPGATLWLAHDTALDRDVTVKMLNEEYAGDAAAVARFEREARLLAKLDHKNIALALSTGRHGRLPFLVMKHLKGRSLAEALHGSGGRFPLGRAAAIGVELCEAVEALHQASVVLSNLQPRQVHLEDTGEVLLIDLGSAHETSDERTRTGEVLGEAGYRAPEVLAGREPDVRSDVYSLGCVVYEMISGRPPFDGRPWELLVAGAKVKPAPELSVLVPSSPPQVARVVREALSHEPSLRPASAEVLRRALLEVAPRLGAALLPVSPGPRELTATEAVTAPVAALEAITAPQARPDFSEPREAMTAPAELTRAAPLSGPREALSEPTQAMSTPPVAAESTNTVPAPPAGPTQALASLGDVPTRAIPGALTAPPLPVPQLPGVLPGREAVTAPRPFLKQPSGRRAALVAGLFVALLLVTVVSVSLSSSQVDPIAPEPLPRSEVQPLAPEQKKELSIDDVAAPQPTELEQRQRDLKIVDPGKESISLARPKLRGGPGYAPWRVQRRGRKPVDTSAQASVTFVALFKNKSVPAQLEIDGVWRGVTPVEVKLAPGDHAVKLDHPGSALTEVLLGFTRGESVKLEIELRTREQALRRGGPPAIGARPE